MDDSGGFKKKRQNLIGISLVLLLLDFLKVETPKELDLFNIKIPIDNPSYFTWAIWILFFYLLYRLYVEWIYSEQSAYKAYISKQLWMPYREAVLKRLQSDVLLKEDLQLISIGMIDKHIRKPWFLFSPLTVPLKRGGKKTLTKGVTNKYIWKNYYHYKIIGEFKRKYFSELLLPIVLVLMVIGFVLVPNIFKILTV